MDNLNEHTSWLKSCPCSDANFKSHLKRELAINIAKLINELPEQGNKSKLQCLKRELKSRIYEVNTFKKNGEIKTSDTFRDYYKALQFYDSLSDEKSKEFVEILEDESGFDFDTIKERIVL